MRWTCVAAMLILAAFGCGEDPYRNAGRPTASHPAAAAPSPAAQEKSPPATQEEPKPAASEKVTREEAKFGVGKRGHDYQPGILTTPVSTYFTIGERVTFDIQIPQALNLYKAQHDNQGPKTHEEFMEKIIKANQIKLPQLPSGARYLYDPKTERLMVEHRDTKQEE
jgi:hypothetical protein